MKKIFSTLIILLFTQVLWACTAGFSWVQSPTAASIYNVNFTGTSVLGGASYAYSYLRFGDGTAYSPLSPGFTVAHDYGAAGTYTARFLFATYDSATSTYCYDSVATTITVTTPPCASSFTHFVIGDSLAVYARTPAGTSGMSYTWDFGDGSTATGAITGHTYMYNGTYHVWLLAESSIGGCSDSVDTTITITGARPLCGSLHASFTHSLPGGFMVAFSNTSTSGGAYYSRKSHWSFGDGDTSSAFSPTHTYASGGSYTVSLKCDWVDTSTGVIACSDSATQVVNLNDSLNMIAGYIFKDTMTAPTDTVVYKVWLISYDSLTHMLTAVDSLNLTDTIVYGNRPRATRYMFINVPAGIYYVKAKIMNGPDSGYGFVPTYHDSSVYWSAATPISYAGGLRDYIYINMQHGTVTSGPGFIAGNVLYGAGKTTGGGTVGAPVQGLLILLRDIKDKVIASGYTDVSGNYKISNIPYGTYSIYPEDMGYRTVAWGGLSITSTNPHVNYINFAENSTSIRPVTTAVPNVATGEDRLSTYPNPTSGDITVQWPKGNSNSATITVVNVAGQVVYTKALNIAGVERSDINLSSLTAGLYFINIVADQLHYLQKISIQH